MLEMLGFTVRPSLHVGGLGGALQIHLCPALRREAQGSSEPEEEVGL